MLLAPNKPWPYYLTSQLSNIIPKPVATFKEIAAGNYKTHQIRINRKNPLSVWSPAQRLSYPILKFWSFNRCPQMGGRYRIGYSPRRPLQDCRSQKAYIRRNGRPLYWICPTKKSKVQEVNQKNQLEWWREHLGSYTLVDVTPVMIVKCRDELAGIRNAAERLLSDIWPRYRIVIRLR